METCFLIVTIENPSSYYQFYVLWIAYNWCVLFHMMTEGNHNLCGGVTEMHGFCGRWNWFLYWDMFNVWYWWNWRSHRYKGGNSRSINISTNQDWRGGKALGFVCELVAARAFRASIAPKMKLWKYIKLFLFFFYYCWVPYTFLNL